MPDLIPDLIVDLFPDLILDLTTDLIPDLTPDLLIHMNNGFHRLLLSSYLFGGVGTFTPQEYQT